MEQKKRRFMDIVREDVKSPGGDRVRWRQMIWSSLKMKSQQSCPVTPCWLLSVAKLHTIYLFIEKKKQPNTYFYLVRNNKNNIIQEICYKEKIFGSFCSLHVT